MTEVDDGVEAAPPPDPAKVAKAIELARKFWVLIREREKLEEAADAKKAEIDALRTRELPDLMIEVGLERVDLSGGWSIKRKKIVAGNVTEANRAKAYAWLEDHGFSDIIKRVITISFGKDESAWAKKFLADLAKRKKPVKAENKESIAPGTFQAFVREMVSKAELGELPPEKALPKDLFGIFTATVAELEGPSDAAPKKKGKK